MLRGPGRAADTRDRLNPGGDLGPGGAVGAGCGAVQGEGGDRARSKDMRSIMDKEGMGVA